MVMVAGSCGWKVFSWPELLGRHVRQRRRSQLRRRQNLRRKKRRRRRRIRRKRRLYWLDHGTMDSLDHCYHCCHCYSTDISFHVQFIWRFSGTCKGQGEGDQGEGLSCDGEVFSKDPDPEHLAPSWTTSNMQVSGLLRKMAK